jgi:hypothetical protein
MSDAQEPDWSLLPHAAQSFFCLEAGFDRKDLKRAYNRLIRRYKPEKHPAEFQRIRAAFEQLENQLRFGQSFTSFFPSVREMSSWDSGASQPDDVPAGDADPSFTASQPAKSLLDRLKSESVPAVYKELSRRKEKTPRQHYELAVLSDLVAPERQLYIKWLLTGLQDCGFDPGLFALVRSYLSLDLSARQLARLLPTVSKVVSDDRFYFLTEPAWGRLLSEGGFEIFRKTLSASEKNLKDHRHGSKLAFYAKMMKAAMWSADAAWISPRLRWLENNADGGNHSLDYDLLVIESLEQYHQNIGELRESSPAIAMMDEAIRGCFTLNEREADIRFIECQHWLVENSQTLLNTFSKPQYDQQIEPLVLLWMTLHEDISQRHGIEIREPNRSRKEQHAMYQRTVALSRELHRHWQFGAVDNILVVLLQWPGMIAAFVIPIVLCVFVATVFSGVVGWATSSLMYVPMALSALAGAAIGWFLIRPQLQRLIEWWVTRRVKSGYRSAWRSQLLAFFDATGSTSSEVSNFLRQADNDDRAGHMSQWIAVLLGSDIGLLVYSIANRYRR